MVLSFRFYQLHAAGGVREKGRRGFFNGAFPFYQEHSSGGVRRILLVPMERECS